MATRRYKISAGEVIGQVTEEAGAAVNSDTVELTVELANTAVNIEGGATRTVTKREVLLGLQAIRQHIIKGDWPPA